MFSVLGILTVTSQHLYKLVQNDHFMLFVLSSFFFFSKICCELMKLLDHVAQQSGSSVLLLVNLQQSSRETKLPFENEAEL